MAVKTAAAGFCNHLSHLLGLIYQEKYQVPGRVALACKCRWNAGVGAPSRSETAIPPAFEAKDI
jgi:hypothetical protein